MASANATYNHSIELQQSTTQHSISPKASIGVILDFPDPTTRPPSIFERDAISDVFGFGVYLEYWKKGMKNSVTPKYKTLRKELTKNRYERITEEQYDKLEKQCNNILFRNARNQFIAENIGSANRIYRVDPGTEMTVEHAICLKLYTDFTDLQREFKKQCRRLHKDETIQDVVERNAEIANWCRLLKECIMFWGETMRPKDVVYSGMSARLMFTSLYQRVECPLSTTSSKVVADQFTNGHLGIRLKLKRASPLTRYFEVAKFTSFRNENECLFMGSSLEIVDIFIGKKSCKSEVSALIVLEQLIKGRFVDDNADALSLLLKFLRKITEISITDYLIKQHKGSRLNEFLVEEDFDTDAVLSDVYDHCSNIRDIISNDTVWHGVAQSIWKRFDKHESLKIALNLSGEKKYFWKLFLNFLREMSMMKENENLWMNKSEIGKPSMSEIKGALFGENGLIQYDDVQWVQQYEWKIEGNEYTKLRNLSDSKCLVSPKFQYKIKANNVSRDETISFRFRMYRHHSKQHSQCAIFLEIRKMPMTLKRMTIEMDMKCIKITKKQEIILFQQWFQPRKISNPLTLTDGNDEKEDKEINENDGNIFGGNSIKIENVDSEFSEMRGFQCFDSKVLTEGMSLKWMFGVKIFNTDWIAEDIPEAKNENEEPSVSASNIGSELPPMHRNVTFTYTNTRNSRKERIDPLDFPDFPRTRSRVGSNGSEKSDTGIDYGGKEITPFHRERPLESDINDDDYEESPRSQLQMNVE